MFIRTFFRQTFHVKAKIDALAPPALTADIHGQLDLAGLPHHTFTDEALGLILRISEGTLRAVTYPCVSAPSKPSATNPKP